MNSYKIYKITFPNNKVYIGQTRRSLTQRLYEHKTDKRGDKQVTKAISKYGFDNLKFEILFDSLSLEEANKKEIELIKKHKNNSYNITESGGHDRYKDEDYRKKLSLSQKGKPRWTDEDKERIRLSKLGTKQSKESNEIRRKKSSKKWTYKGEIIEDLFNYCKRKNLSYWVTRRFAKQL